MSGEYRRTRTLAAVLILGSASVLVGSNLSQKEKTGQTNQLNAPAANDSTILACGNVSRSQKLAITEKIDSDGAWRPVMLKFDPKYNDFQFGDAIPVTNQEPLVTAQRDAATIAGQVFPEDFDVQKFMDSHRVAIEKKAGQALATYCVQVTTIPKQR